MWRIRVHGYIPRSPNANPRSHWSRKTDERNFWEGVIGSQAYMMQIPQACVEVKRCVRYHIYKPGKIRLRDEDNLQASIKHVQDACVNLGLFIDDSREYLVWDGVTESNGHKGYMTDIWIWDEGE